jgi:carotenoid cleavage dioxygenase-like enzyme
MNTLKPWSKAFTQTAQEFSLTTLPVISGKVPDELRGSLYRNGPGRFSRGKQKIGHWFDGDGAILGVHFTEEKVEATYRFVQTKGYLEEEKADKFLFANYGMKAQGLSLTNLFQSVKNSANTSVLALENKLLALWEGGYPYALTLDNLETKGEDNLDFLKGNQAFSAHPKIDPNTGNIYNFGVVVSNNAILNLYQCNKQGKLIKQTEHKLSGFPLIHDFVMAGDYLIFFVSPVRINLLSIIAGFKSYSEAMDWKPKLGTEILVFNKHDLSLISRGETEPWFQWHYTNGYVEKDGSVVVELVRFEDFKTNQNLKEVATGKTETPAQGNLYRVRIKPENAQVLEINKILDQSCEFPVISPFQVGKEWRYTFLSLHRKNADLSQEILGEIGVFDHKTNTLSRVNWNKNLYASEPIFVPKSQELEEGLVLTVVYDGKNDQSQIWIFDSKNLSEEPLCRLQLPSVVPPSFHGTWKSV